MITYNLAKKLKDAGFQQVVWVGQNFYEEGNDVAYIATNFMENEGMYTKIKIPDLAELIEACGEEFGSLFQSDKGWIADKGIHDLPQEGSTPEEAISNLWLATNKKV